MIARMNPRAIANSKTSDVHGFRLHLLENAQRYFSDFTSGVQVDLTCAKWRKLSVMLEFELSDASQRRTVLVKTHRARRDENRLAQTSVHATEFLDHPRLAPWISLSACAQMEYDALKMIEAHFERLNDDRFACVRALDVLADRTAVITEKLSMLSLRDLFVRRQGFATSIGHVKSVLQAFHNSGSWLRELHKMPPLTHARIRHTTRADFVASVCDFADFLTQTHGNKSFFKAIADLVKNRAVRSLPAQLPIGQIHGDFGARNVLADATGRVAGFDTRARCRAPIYEDIGYFLVMLHTDSPRLHGMPAGRSAQLVKSAQAEFLTGYFGNNNALPEGIHLFEIQALLKKWVPYTLGYREATGIRKFAKLARLRLFNRFFYSHLRHLARELEKHHL